MPTISNIAIEESATVTGRVATVAFDRGGVTVDQEIMCLGDPDSSNALAACSSVSPAASAIGLVTRPIPSTGFWRVQNSSAADFVSNVSSVAGRILVDQNSTVWAVQMPSSQSVGSVLDANNASSVALGGDASFVGTATDISAYSNVTVSVYADEGSAVDGMTFEFSQESSNWDDVYTFTMSSGSRRFVFPAVCRYFRVNYTNGSTAQGAFRVQTLLHHSQPAPIVHRLQDAVHEDRSAILTKSAIIAQTSGSTDTFSPITATAGGNLKVSVEEGTVGVVSSVAGRVLVDQNSTVWAVQIPSSQGVIARQSSAADLNVTVAGYSTTVNVSSLAGTVQLASTQNVLEAREFTDLSTTVEIDSTASSASYDLISSAAGSVHRVYAYSVMSTMVAPSTCEFLSSTNGTTGGISRWGLIVGSASSGVTGANLAMSPPYGIFKTQSADELRFRATQSGVYRIALSYWTE